MASPESTPPPPPPPWLPLETKDCSQGLCSPFCPQWCYILFPPPPPFSFDPENVDSSSTAPTFSPLVIAIIGILSCAFLLIGYYTIVSKFCGASFIRGCHSRRGAPPGGSESDDEDPGMQSRRRRHDQEWHLPPTVGLDEALISKITVCRYKRGDGLVGCTDCSVCLGEFREDESLRLLPKCGHAFHVRCIDTWLKSHSNCPLCRASIVVLVNPAPLQLPTPPPPRPVSSETSDETVVVVVGESTEEGEGTGSENGGEDAMEEAVDDDEIMVGGSSSRQSDGGGEHSKQGSGSSTGRYCLTRQGRGRNSVLPM